MPGKIILNGQSGRKRKPKKPFAIELPKASSHGIAHPAVEILDFHPTRLNEALSMHWRRRAQRKNNDELTIAAACYEAGLTAALGKRRVRYVITLKKGQRTGDEDAYDKNLYDALVKCGALVNDSPVWCEQTKPKFERGERMKTTIYFEDLT